MSLNQNVKRIGVFAGACLIAYSFAEGPAAAEDAAPEGWTGEIALSVTAQAGSVDTFAGSIDALAERKWEKDLVDIRFKGVYGTSRDRKNNPANTPSGDDVVQDSQGLFAGWKHTIQERYFWVSGAEASRDSTQDREARARFDTGPGYRFWQGENVDAKHFDVSVGLGYRFELYDGNQGPNTTEAPLGIFTTLENGTDQHLADVFAAFEYKNLMFDDRVDWTHTFKAAMPMNKTTAYILSTEGILGVPLSDAWSLRASIGYEYVNDVPKDVNPSRLLATLGLGYKF